MEDHMATTQNKVRAERVKQERIRRAWPQGQLAEISGVSLRTIQRLEKDGIAAFETLKAVASAFELDVSELSPSSRRNEKAFQTKGIYVLPRLKSGKDVADIVGGLDGNDSLQPTFDQADDKESVDLIAKFFDLLAKVAVDWRAADSARQVHFAFWLSEALEKLETSGFYVFGIKREVRQSIEDKTTVKMSTIYVVRSNSPKIVGGEKSTIQTVPAMLRNTALNY